MDRLITIHVDYFDRETEVAIAAARSGVSHVDAGRVVDLVRHFREQRVGRHRPSLRAAIMIARVVAQRGGTFDPSDLIFQRTYRDVLGLDRIGAHGAARTSFARCHGHGTGGRLRARRNGAPGIRLIRASSTSRWHIQNETRKP